MRDFTNIKKVVIKLGTNTLSKPNSIEIDYGFIKQLAKQIVQLRKKNIQVVIVTSGAIGMGAGYLKLDTIDGPKMRQACAAIGQPLLMDAYKKAFNRYKVKIAQVLLTSHVLDNRITYKNLRNTIDQLLDLSVVPIINENDCVSTEEIDMTFGDNDKLSARVASKIEADLLILLTDIDALYNKDPRKHKDAAPISQVKKITAKIIASAGGSGTKHATGGMKSKIEAVKIAFEAGCRIVLANGREVDVITKIIDGKVIGTLFIPEGVKTFNERERWIANRASQGKITVDGIRQKIKRQQDILPRDILSVKGVFKEGDVITINELFKSIAMLNSDSMKLLKGKKKKDLKEFLGDGYGGTIAIKAEDIVPIND